MSIAQRKVFYELTPFLYPDKGHVLSRAERAMLYIQYGVEMLQVVSFHCLKMRRVTQYEGFEVSFRSPIFHVVAKAGRGSWVAECYGIACSKERARASELRSKLCKINAATATGLQEP
jgi:hypothetical protein